MVTLEDSRLKSGLNVFFQDFVNSLELRSHAKKLLETASETCKVGLVSNFTYAPAIHSSLRKLEINQFFTAVVISHDVGWRKPHRMIFEQALKALQVKAKETVYVGDSPAEDIKGAKAVGLRTVFVPSQFYSLAELQKYGGKPDLIVRDLREICANFPHIIRLDNLED
jgi:putative hydrolase of the HAD superfamily